MFFILIRIKGVYTTSINISVWTLQSLSHQLHYAIFTWPMAVQGMSVYQFCTETDRRFYIFRSGHSWNSGDPSCLLCPLTTLVNKCLKRQRSNICINKPWASPAFRCHRLSARAMHGMADNCPSNRRVSIQTPVKSLDNKDMYSVINWGHL